MTSVMARNWGGIAAQARGVRLDIAAAPFQTTALAGNVQTPRPVRGRSKTSSVQALLH